MKQILVFAVLIFGGVFAWQIGESLSSDAISMGLGIFFGMLAGLPAALLVLAASRRNDYTERERTHAQRAGAYPNYGAQPPIIVVTAPSGGGQMGQMGGQLGFNGGQPMMELPMWGNARQERQFKVVGEREELVDEW